MIIPMYRMPEMKTHLPVGTKVRCTKSENFAYKVGEIWTICPNAFSSHGMKSPRGVTGKNGLSAEWEVLIDKTPLEDYL
jgi:hypothetical protein